MKIIVLDGQTANPGDNSWQQIEALGELTVYDQTAPEEVVERSLNADILLTNKVKVTADILQQLPSLKFISVLATGFDVVDVLAAAKQNVPVSNIPEYSTNSVAQHVFCGLLSLLSRPDKHYQAILNGAWQRSGQFSFWETTLVELSGKTMGIVGLGRIGQAVARIAQAMEMNVIAAGRSIAGPDKSANSDSMGIKRVDIEQLFETADVISLHCPLTPATRQMINRERLSRMKRSAILVNTARGALVDETDLADALNSDVIAGAFLDVVSQEPIIATNPMLRAKNCLLTPHIGWATIEARQRLLQVTARNIAAFLAGSPINRVN